MSGSPPLSPHDSRHSPVIQCDQDTPSTSYYTQPETSYLHAVEQQPTFLKCSTYGQISYEVDDTNGSFNYSYNPRRTYESDISSTSKYLEDTSYSGHGMLDAPPEYLLINAPASVPSNFSYLSDYKEHKNSVNVQSPRDDAQFSTPEYVPDSMPTSAPMSSEINYIPSPADGSEYSTVTLNDSEQTAATIGQSAKRASHKDVRSQRYESPKNCDNNWTLKAFHSSSDDINSLDDDEPRSSNDDDAANMDSDELDGRVSMVDRLFALLQRSEQECSDLVDEPGDGETNQKDSYMPQNSGTLETSKPSTSHLFQQTQHLPEAAHLTAPLQSESSQEIVAGTSQCSQRHTFNTHVGDPFHSQTSEDLPFCSTLNAPPLSQYHTHYAFHQYSREHNNVPILEQNPSASLSYNQTPYIVQHHSKTPINQYFQPITAENVSNLPLNINQGTQFYPVYPKIWNIGLYEENLMSTLQQQSVQKATQPESLSHNKSKERIIREPAQDMKKLGGISFDSESETDIDAFDSISLQQSVGQEIIDELQDEPKLKGPPFEQKGPTRKKEIKPVPRPPPPSPVNIITSTHIEGMDRSCIIEQLRQETNRLEDIGLSSISDFDRTEEIRDLCEKMNSRFQRFYPHLNRRISDEEIDKEASEEEIIIDGEPEDGYIMRNGVQLTTKYLALWFPEEKQREEMIPWNIMRKVKPIRLCFLDNRIGHGEFENFSIGDFVSSTGHMMFTYGDGPEALDETRLFVLDIVRQQMNMLLRRVWSNVTQTYQRRVITYTNIFNLYKNHPIRLRRLVRYLIEQNRIRHMLYRVMVDQGRRRGQHYIENRMGVNDIGATEVIFLRKRAPHIYYALKENYEDQLDFLCEEKRIQDCDPDLADIKMFLKRRNRHLSEEHKELLNFARRVSYCSRTGRLSAFRAHRFHEFLGFPDLQTDLIYVLDFIAREIVMEVTYHAAIVREQERQIIAKPNQGFLHQPISKAKLVAENMELRHYEDGLRMISGWRQNQDILFGANERKVMLSYGRNPRKWESDRDYNKREAIERNEFEALRPMPRHHVSFTSKELFNEHKKVLRGEYWDSSPEDLTKEAFVLANMYAAARQAQIEVPQPNIPQKWKEQNQQDIKDENDRLDKLRGFIRENKYEKLTEQLAKMMEKNSIDEPHSSVNVESEVDGNDGFDVRSMMKTIQAAVHRYKNFDHA